MKQLRERLQEYGSQTLLTEELLAIMLGTGSRSENALELASKLLVKYGGLGGLMQVDCEELRHEYGLGEVKVALIKAMLEIGKRLNKLPPEEKYRNYSGVQAMGKGLPWKTAVRAGRRG